MTTINPYTMCWNKDEPKLQRLGLLVAERLGKTHDDFVKAMTALIPTQEQKRLRCKGAQMIRLAEASMLQAKIGLEGIADRLGYSRKGIQAAMTNVESLAAGTGALADMTAFVTQMIHTSLEIWPRLLSNELVSMQPLNQPSGYVFFRRSKDQNDRNLSDLDTFDPDFTTDPGEGEQITDMVRTTIEKELVEAVYRKIMHKSTWEVEVAMRTTFGIELEPVNDALMNEQLIWTIDRTVINRLVSFADQDYYFDPTAGGTYDGMAERDKQAYDDNFLRKTYNRVETDMQATIFRTPNFAIAGTEVIAFLKKLRKFESYKEGGNYGDMVLSNGSVQFSGKINDMNVWHDPQLDQCLMLVGYIDKNDPFYAGFIMSMFGAGGILTAAFRDPNTLQSRKAQAVAFATKGIRAAQFKRVWIQQCS